MTLNVGKYNVIIDDEDLHLILDGSLWVHNTKGYVYFDKYINGNRCRKRLHRLVMGIDEKGIQVDHKNMNKLDNRKSNLRLCNNKENHANRGLNKNNISGARGVSRSSYKIKKWRARYSSKTIGYYITKQEAINAYDSFITEAYGEFARTNS